MPLVPVPPKKVKVQKTSKVASRRWRLWWPNHVRVLGMTDLAVQEGKLPGSGRTQRANRPVKLHQSRTGGSPGTALSTV